MKTKTKTLFATLAAATAVAAIAVPAAAQGYGDRYDHGRYEQGRYEQGRWDRHDTTFDRREAMAIRRIENGARSGDLTRAEVRHLRDIVRGLSNLEDRYSRDGLNRWERADLDRRYDRLEEQIGFERRDRELSYGYRR
jgi:Spy/CpxP family protein refolding chaperone